MASSPPFLLEDQTDEDFFDKLVNDDDDDVVLSAPSSSLSCVPNLADGNDSDVAKEFANLSTGEDSGGENGSHIFGGDDKTSPVVAYKDEKSSSLVSSNSVGSNNGIESNNGAMGTEWVSDLTATNSSLNSGDMTESNIRTVVGPDLTESKSNGSGGSGVKEVQWSAFNSDSLQNGGVGFGSYSDIFGQFGDGGNAEENLINESNVLSGGEEHKPTYLDNAHNYSQFSQGQEYAIEPEQSIDGQDLNSSQYWDNLYPGWKYDQNTGQWYQIDGYDATSNFQGSFEAAVSDEKSEVSYLQQTAQSAMGTISQSGTTERVTNWNQDSQVGDAGWNWNQVSQATDTTESVSDWNQVSQGNNGYPSHMIFDPQYPGWYYDTIAQEWLSLEAYVPSIQSTTVQAENHLNQNGYVTSHENDQKTQGVHGKVDNNGSTGFSNQGQDYRQAGPFSNYNQYGSNVGQPDSVTPSVVHSEFSGSLLSENHYSQNHSVNNDVSQQTSYSYGETDFYNKKASQGSNDFSTISGHQGFIPGGNFSQPFNQPRIEQNAGMPAPNDYYGSQNVVSYSQQPYQSGHQVSYFPAPGRSSAGRPPHALVAFGFGGKLILMKENTSSLGTSSYGSQDQVGGSIAVVNLMEVVNGRIDASSTGAGVCDYFHTLCRQSFTGPLTGGNVGAKELNRWIDERIAHCESSDVDYRKGQVFTLLFSLLKIACQHYGKLRSPFGTDTSLKENDGPESAVARLFASAKRNGSQISEYSALDHCLQKLPSEGQMRATAAEVQTLLVSGRKREALHCAQEGQLWGPALVLAAQLGDQLYAETVKQMALRQLVAGSPLRTLCLLIAGQPAEVFSANTAADGGISGDMYMSRPPAQLDANGMLDDWEENLAVVTANRTKDDELVLIHLGDCLWKERSEIIAAHICYLVAEANFEPYSDSARLCLVGADHFKFPRTYASPEAIQRTEIYEYSKLLGNSQFILLPFQPYKLVYAHMLAEVGRVSESMKYCQAVSKSLKTGRAQEVETWRQLASSLEERIKTHQQGGFSSNLAPARLVGKLITLFDSTAHRVVGGLPPPAPSTTVEHFNQSSGPRVSTSQSTMAMSSLITSASMEPVSADGNRRTMHNRSVSEPDFGRTPRQDQPDSSQEATANSQGKSSVSGGTSRFGRFGFGSQFLQKILKPRQDKQAKLGDTNKFYYDEKLKRWVEEGVELPPEEAAPPPPPTTMVFSNGTSDYNLNTALKSEGLVSNGSPEYQSPPSLGHGAGIPPIPPTSNQFSARGRMGVRSRYVDTFNKGGGNPTNLFQSPSVPSIKPNNNSNPKFFVPAPVSSVEQQVDPTANNIQQITPSNENPVASSTNGSFQTFAPPSSSMNMQRFASMDDISNNGGTTMMTGISGGSLSSHSRRTASWSGSMAGSFSPPNQAETKPLGEVLGTPPSSFIPNSPALTHSSVNGGSYSDDLHEVEL